MDQKSSQIFRRSALLPQVEMRRAHHSLACYHTHTHDEFSVGVIDAGSAVCRQGSAFQTLHQGTVVVINPGDAHSCNPRADQAWSYRMLFIDAHWLGGLQADLPGSRSGDYRPLAVASSPAARAYAQFDALFEALEREDDDAWGLEAQLMDFLMPLGQGDAAVGLAPSTPQRQLGRAREMILDQLEDKITLDDVAQVAGLSRYHLIRSFKQAYGQTPHAFLLDQRINRAKQLLKQGNSMVDVAQQLGFADQSHFQRHFKKRHAVTPMHYQRSLA
ncbi:MAG: transcriptional regulator [Burkholderiales bacterium RIFCSPLOWO2_12_FULL_61_40]|nr:MAG: transcriptional regulator [Burkholderiales bacterium RIFCSPLOWO2_12_FULL_61_40]